MNGDDDAERGDIPDPRTSDELKERMARGEAAYCRACGYREGLPYLAGLCLICHPEALLRATPPTPPDPWRPDELRERVARGESMYCMACKELEGLPQFGGRCPGCDNEDFVRGRLSTGTEPITAAISTALGYAVEHSVPYTIWNSRDASHWDNREFRGWKGFHIQLQTILRRDLSWRTLPMLWKVILGDLPNDAPRSAQRSRLALTSEEEPQTPTDELVIRVLLWRVGESGYLHGQWMGQLRCYRWDLCDYNNIPPWRKSVWDAAVREASPRGPKPGSRKSFGSYDEFAQACHTLVIDESLRNAQRDNSPQIKTALWKSLVAGKLTQEALAYALYISPSALMRALREYRRSNDFEWRAWQRDLADLAKEIETAHPTN